MIYAACILAGLFVGGIVGLFAGAMAGIAKQSDESLRQNPTWGFPEGPRTRRY